MKKRFSLGMGVTILVSIEVLLTKGRTEYLIGAGRKYVNKCQLRQKRTASNSFQRDASLVVECIFLLQ